MTTVFVTGATGFIGRRMLARLLTRSDLRVIALVRPGSLARFGTMLEAISGGDRVISVTGDITEDGLGLSDGDDLGDIDHVVHLAAIYDLMASDESQQIVNVEGTERVAQFAADHGAMLHHISSIAVAGDHNGTFTEEDFEVGQNFPTPYHRTKFAAERVVREQPGLRWRIYRPSAVVGDSTTGETEKADGPYYFFDLITQFARLTHLPTFVRLPMVDLGPVNVVPVDYVVDAVDALMFHEPGRHGQIYHLGDPKRRNVTDLLNALAPATGSPRGFDVLPAAAIRPLINLAGRSPFRAGRDITARQLGIPGVLMDMVGLPVDFRSDATAATLAKLGFTLPDLYEYAPVLWEYWAENLDPARFRWEDPRGPLVGKHILITGGSSGIGKATARMCVSRGAHVFIVGRDTERLSEAVDDLNSEQAKPGLPQGTAHAYQCDITDEESVRTLIKEVIADHDHVDVLVNDAGRSIRRATVNALDRSHDYHRVMAVNYFGAVYLTLALLPHFLERQNGHIVNVSSIATQSHGPRFGAYGASKAALEAFGDSLATETLSDHITVSNVRLPLTRTRMIAPTEAYDGQRGVWKVDKAASRVLQAIIERPRRTTTALGTLADFGQHFAPRITNRILHLDYLAIAESEAALGHDHTREDSPNLQ